MFLHIIVSKKKMKDISIKFDDLRQAVWKDRKNISLNRPTLLRTIYASDNQVKTEHIQMFRQTVHPV